MNKDVVFPAIATHPGELIADELEERGIQEADFAIDVKMTESRLHDIIVGKRLMNAAEMRRVASALDIPFEIWQNLQRQYRADSEHLADAGQEQVVLTIPRNDRALLKEVAQRFGWACML